MKPIILYRAGQECMSREELLAAQKHFECVPSRLNIPRNSLVIGRYSVLPFYKELEDDVTSLGSRLINSYKQHRYVADLQNWTYDLGDLTPTTWTRLEDLPDEGPFVLKGETNSKKFEWATHMYAENKRAAIEVHSRLCRDGLIGSQSIYIRKFMPLVTYGVGLSGLPITKEFRLFVAFGRVICGAFYWSSHVDEVQEIAGDIPTVADVPQGFLDIVLQCIGQKVNFYALDVGQCADGSWIVIELNDGQMSGLSLNSPDDLYTGLMATLNDRGSL